MHAGRIAVLGDELAGRSRQALRAHRGRDMAMIFQEPMTSLNPVMRVGAQITEVLRCARGARGAEARERAVDMLAQVEIPTPRARLDALSAPAVGRHAPAGDDRDGAGLRARSS